ncbi:hypothetical protein VINI7043_16658, partial [Vibrio nigripulchritudo ATCC 27043]
AELKLLIDFAVGCKCPLVVMVGDLHKGSIKDFPHANQYVILPFRGRLRSQHLAGTCHQTSRQHVGN